LTEQGHLARAIEENPSLHQVLSPRLTRYIPHAPTIKQRALLCLNNREAFYGGAAGGGKQVQLSEPIVTPTGWMTIGELRIGDEVFDELGQVCRVKWLSPVDLAPEAYRMTFDDGTQIVSCADHQWLTYDARELSRLTKTDEVWMASRRAKRASRSAVGSGNRKKFTESHRQFLSAMTTKRNRQPKPLPTRPTGSVRTTREIATTLRTKRGRTNHAIPVTAPLALPEAVLPLDPYVLGLWLGDGTSKAGSFTTADSELLQAFVGAGFRAGAVQSKPDNRASTYSFLGLRTVLRQMGLFGNKHLPAAYLRSSPEQRLALLQGLMDTDGTVCSSGSVEFTTTNEQIAAGVFEVICSLGWKVRSVKSRALCNGKDYGPKWDMKWTPDKFVFRLERKREKQRLAVRRTTRFRYVIACERCETAPMRCIGVDSPSRLFLVGRSMVPTHNSDALLMAALQYVDIPNYHALIVRKTIADASAPGSLLYRSRQWLRGTDARHKDATWYFPSGAILKFGMLRNMTDAYTYQSTEFQYIGFDEAGHFEEDWVEYVCTRLRRTVCPHHVKAPADDCVTCLQYSGLAKIPLRIRMAANPGGRGHAWIKRRFDIRRHPTLLGPSGQPLYVGLNPQRPHIPAFIQDNPYLDQQRYIDDLTASVKDPITRAQLLAGDWGVSVDGRFRRGWAKYYDQNGAYLTFAGRTVLDSDITRFVMADSASTTTNSPAEKPFESRRNQKRSWHVITVWALTFDGHLLLRDVRKFRDESPELIKELREVAQRWHVAFVGLEYTTQSIHLYQILRNLGVPMRPFPPKSQDKIARSADAANRMYTGKIWFPADRPAWLDDWEDEIFTWTGDPGAVDDQVDCLSYAAIHASSQAFAENRTAADMPSAI